MPRTNKWANSNLAKAVAQASSLAPAELKELAQAVQALVDDAGALIDHVEWAYLPDGLMRAEYVNLEDRLHEAKAWEPKKGT